MSEDLNNKSLFPTISKSIQDFLYEEEGNISRSKIMFIGSLLIISGIMLHGEEIFAAHRSHSSHSSHSSHRSHSSHTSHSSSTHSSHASSTVTPTPSTSGATASSMQTPQTPQVPQVPQTPLDTPIPK